MGAEHTGPQASGKPDKRADRPCGVGTNMDYFGVGSWEDFQRYLVLPLQSRFQEEVRRDDGRWDTISPTGKFILRNTLHGQLLDHVLEFAGAIRLGLDKLGLARFLRRRDR